MFHVFWVLICFFAVIGILECLLGLLNWLSFRKVKAVRKITLQVELEGNIENIEYLLNSLCLKAEKADIGEVEARVEILDGGLAPAVCREICSYCEKNPWVIFTERAKDDII